MSRPKSSGRSRDAATAGKPSSSRPSTAGPRETSSDISGTHRNTRSNEKIAQNWTAHNYDLAKLMQYHLEVINFPKPSAETTRWKTPVETVRYTKNIAKELLQQQLLEKNNINLSNRLTDIVSADRRFDTQEYSPGWRIGKGGTVIDCYPTELYSAEKFKALHGTSQRNKREKKRIEKENEQLFHYLSNAKPVYDRKQIKKDYERNREMKKKFTKETALTASHLGLVRAAKQFITRRAIMQESKSYYKKGSAFNADNAPILSPGKLFLDEIRKSDPYDLKKITTEIRLKDGWNDATNDNLHNSHYNKVERKNADSYNEPKSFETSYLKQCSIVNQSISATPSMLVNPKFGRQAYAVEVKDSRPHSAAPRLTSRNDSGQLSSIEKTKNEVDSDNDRERLKKLAAIKRNVSFTYKVDHSELASGMLEASSHQLSLVRPLSAPEVLPVKKEKEQEQEQQLENVQLPEITPASEEQIKSLGWRRPSMSAAYQERKKSQGLLTNQEHHRIDRLRKCSSASSRATRFGRSSLYSHTIAESTDDNNDIWYDTMNENSIQYVLPTPDDIAYEKLREIGIEDDSHEEHFSIRQSLLSQQVFRLKEEEDIPENICLDYLVRIIDIGYDLPAAKKTKIIRYDSRRSIDIMDDEIFVKSVNESGSYDSEDSEDESDLALPSTLGIVIESAPLVKNTGKRKSESEYLVNVYDEKNIRHLFIPIARLYDLSVNTGHIEIQNMLFEMRSLCYFYRGSQQLDVHNRYHKTKSTSDLLSTIGIDTAAPKSPGKEENETRGKRSKFSKPKLKRHRSTKELTTFKDEDRHDVIYPPLLSMFDKDLENELINMIYENMELTFDYFKRRVVVDLIK